MLDSFSQATRHNECNAVINNLRTAPTSSSVHYCPTTLRRSFKCSRHTFNQPASIHSHSLPFHTTSLPLAGCPNVHSLAMASKPTGYTAFLPNTLLTVINSKAFIPFILSNPLSGNEISLAAIAATQHQRHADLLYLPQSATLAQALDFFRRYDITAVPVVSDSGEGGGGGSGVKAASGLAGGKVVRKVGAKDIVGVFTMQDLIRPLISHSIFEQAPASIKPDSSSSAASASSTSASTSPAPSSSSSTQLSEADFIAQLSNLPLWSTPILSYLSCTASNRHEWFLLSTATVHDAALALSSGYRHILVSEADSLDSHTTGDVALLSAGDLARYVYTSLPEEVEVSSGVPERLVQLLRSPISQHFKKRDMVTFQERDITINAFRRLALAGPAVSSSSPSSSPRQSGPIGAVPIVNKSGMVIDNLSATDIRLLTPATFHHILHPLADFLAALRSAPSPPASAPTTPSSASAAAARSLRPAFAATVNGQTSVHLLLEKVVTLGISRVWVVDEEARPVGVVALSDIFRLLVEYQSHK